jgi:glutathione S-transferase
MGSARSPADCMLPNIAKPQSKQRMRVSIAPKPCLYYHPFAGRAELTRLIAAAGGIELEEKAAVENIASFGSPGSMPCLAHGELKIAQSFAIENYIASISPKFSQLTEEQRAVDDLLCKMKEDVLQAFHSMLEDPSEDQGVVGDEVAKVCGIWFPVIEHKLPGDGFIHGLAFPTAADLAVLNVAEAFMPFGAVYMLGNYNVHAEFPKFAAHANRVANFPSIKAYLQESETFSSDPFGLRQQKLEECWSRTPSMTQESGRNDEVCYDDLPSARLYVPEDVASKSKAFQCHGQVNSSGMQYADRTVWMCPPGETTIHWRPTEQSLARESYNDIIRKNLKMTKPTDKFDVSESMMKGTSLSRQAQMGPDWIPSGLLCRRIANSNLTGVPLGDFAESYTASIPLETSLARSRQATPELMPKPPGRLSSSSNGRTRRNLRALGIVQ